jgi:hypothetical protein
MLAYYMIVHLCQFSVPVSGHILINRIAAACRASGSVTGKNVDCLGSLVHGATYSVPPRIETGRLNMKGSLTVMRGSVVPIA